MAMQDSRHISLEAGLGLMFLGLDLVFACGRIAAAGQSQPAAEERDRTFTLHEVSVFDRRERPLESLLEHFIVCRDAPDANVVAYPTFQSDHPLYARVHFPASADGQGKATIYRLAIDESGGTRRGYDRLYFDLNHDGDLTNDKCLGTQKDPPKSMTPILTGRQLVCFETVAIPLPFGSQDWRPVELMPRLIVSTGSPNLLSLVATKARHGVIQIDDRNYLVWLSHGSTIAGWFDHPQTSLYMAPVDNNARLLSWNCEWLMATRKIDGTFYRFSATPAGDKLTVHPCTGPLGVLQAGLGGRTIDPTHVKGWLRSSTTTVPVLVTTPGDGSADPTRSCKLPVGDYRVESLEARFGSLSFAVLANGRVGDHIAIREDKPFILDFSGKPQVQFTAPPGDRRIKLGQEITVTALLIDPSLGLRFRHVSYDQKRWDPKVTITRAGGAIVAQGVMPFG